MTLAWNTLLGWLEAQGFEWQGPHIGHSATGVFWYPRDPAGYSDIRDRIRVSLHLTPQSHAFWLRLLRNGRALMDRQGYDLSADQVAREVEEFLVAYDAEVQKAPGLGAIHPGDPDFEDMDDPYAVADFDADVIGSRGPFADERVGEMAASVQVDVWPRGKRHAPGVLEPTFYLIIRRGRTDEMAEAAITLKDLIAGKQPSKIYGGAMTIPPDTRQQMLVWWDQHGEEVEARGPLDPHERVGWFLARAGLPVKPCGLNADWNVQAWHLSPGRPNVTPGVYLLDTEEEIRSGVPRYALVRRRYDPEDEGDDIEDIAEGTLAEMIARAKEELA